MGETLAALIIALIACVAALYCAAKCLSCMITIVWLEEHEE